MFATTGGLPPQRRATENIANVESEAHRLFGYAWGDFASAVKDAKNTEEMRTNLREVMDKYHRTALPNDIQKAVFDYAQAYNAYRAAEQIQAKAVQDGLRDQRDIDYDNWFEEGRQASDKHAVRARYEAARTELAGILGMDDAETEQFIPANNLLAYDVADRYEEEGNIETTEAVRNYIAERARRNGMTNEIATEALHNRDRRFAEVDAITNDDGNIYSITLGNGVKGYVVGKSRVITRDDGSIDTAATAEANEGGYIYVNEDGKVRTVVVNGLATLDSVKSAQEEKKAISQEEYAVFQANYDAMTAAPVETQEATPASTEVAPESAAPAETAAAPVNNIPIVSNEVAENAARALGLLVDELNDAIKDEQKGLAIAANYDRVDDTDSADAIRAYVAERFGTPAVQSGNNVADKREQSTSSLDAMPSESNLGEANGAENIPAEQAPEAPVLSPEQQRKAKRAEIAKRIPTKGKNKLWTQAKAEDVAEYIATLTDDAAVQQATADKYIADIKEKQAKMDAIEALELNDDIAFWESVKGLLAPVETQAEEGATAQAPEVIPAPTAENEMQPVAEVTEQPLSAGSEEAGEPVGNSEQLNQSGDNTEMGARLINEASKEDHPSVIAANEGQDTVGGSPVTLAYLLEGGKGSILNAGYFLHGVAAAFPEITNEIEAIRRGMSDDVLGMNPIDFAAHRAEEIAIISELIEGKYGEEGLSVFSELLNNADGFYPREGLKMSARIEALQPVNSSTNALQNENNNLNLQQENVSDNESNQNDTPVGGQVSESVPQGEHGEVATLSGGAQEAAARLRERIESAQRNSKSGLREIENRVTREFAQENGLWIENEFKLGTPFPSGDEHNNYIDAENQVIYKVNNRMHTPSILELLDRIELHNKSFPNTQYRLVGFTAVGENSDVWPVFVQDYVSDARMASIEEIDSYMGALGFTRVGDGRYSNGEVVIKDLKPRNVLADPNGDIYVVDAEFEDAQQNLESTTPTIGEQVQAAEAEVNTTPTDKQKEAGNYKKGHVQIGTFNVTIEQPRGSVRSGVDKGGKKWEVEMQNTYGYIRGTEGVDGDHIDVFLSNDIDGWNGRQVYVIDQRNADGSFDEHKVMLGFNDINEAEEAYLSNYEEGWQGLGAITGVAIEDFEKWISSSHRKTKAFAEYKSVKTTEGQSVSAERRNLAEAPVKTEAPTISQESEQVKDEKVLSESEYADVRSAEIMADNINLDDVEAYNMALDEYPKYIGDMIKSGKLSQIYKKATVGERIALNKMIQAAGYEISDVNTQEVKEDSKKAESKFKVGDVVTATFGDGSVVSGAIEKIEDGKIKIRSNGRLYPVDESKIGKGVELQRGSLSLDSDNPAFKAATEKTMQALEETGVEVVMATEEQVNEVLGADFSRAAAPFYSNARKAVLDIKQEKATPEQWVAMLKKNGGLKAGEDAWVGLEAWLNNQQGTVTKQEILDYLTENSIQIEEVEYAKDGEIKTYEELPARSTKVEDWRSYGREQGYVTNFWAADVLGGVNGKVFITRNSLKADGREVFVPKINSRYLQQLDEDFPVYYDTFEDAVDGLNEYFDKHRQRKVNKRTAKAANDTRLDYTTEGLDNEREIALVVPTVEPYNESDEVHFGDAGGGRAVAWVRFGETTDSEGNRVLVIDEIQSKRHQDGREKGYGRTTSEDVKSALEAVNAAQSEFDEYNAEMAKKYGSEYDWNIDATDAEIDKWQELYDKVAQLGQVYEDVAESNRKGIPSAPFEKNWHELAMKRMLRLAAEEGFDKVAWTTGEQQAERYNIGQSVELIQSEDNNTELFNDGVAVAKDVRIVTSTGSNINLKVGEDGIIRGGEFAGKSVSEVFGKDLSTRIMNPGRNTIENDGLRIGGEGMKGFYDRMLPSFVQKYTKKWGAKVGEVTMPDLKENNTMHSVDVTPEMRESVMQGQPMFLRTANGTVYGWAVNGKIFLTPDGINPNTPVHEYTHLWASAIEQNDPKLWSKIVEAMKQSPVWNEVMADEAYRDIWNDDNRVASEVLSRLSGNENYRRTMQEAALRENDPTKKFGLIAAWGRVKRALADFWNAIKGLFGADNAMPWERFVNSAIGDFYKGVNPNVKNSSMERMFIGEKGAKSLDNAEEATTRLDNLAIAREMETAGKDAKAVKMATGWERGADGKWRYETEDVRVNKEAKLFSLEDYESFPITKSIEDGRVNANSTVKLSKLVNDKELFSAYPEMNEYFVSFEKMAAETKGSHNFVDRVIRINKDDIGSLDSTLAHEIQHAIQSIEGFAKGGNSSTVAPMVQTFRTEVAPLHNAMLDTPEWAEKKRLQNRWLDEWDKTAPDETYMAQLQERIDEIDNSGVLKEIEQKQAELIKKYGYNKTVVDIISEPYSNDAEIWNNLPEDFYDRYEAYHRLAGEVESRNVQKRMNMSAEERRASLAAETEDVARKDQIFLYDNLGESASEGYIPSDEYEVLRQAVMRNNSLYGKNKPIETAFTANYFYIYNNYGDDNFSVVEVFPIEGNEDLIEFYNSSIQDGTYRNYKDFSKAAAAFRSQQEQRNRGKRDVKEQRGENAGTVSVDLRQSSERGGDNAQGNSDAQGEGIQKVNSEIISAVNKLAAELHTDVEIVNEVSAIPDARKRGTKGWYDGRVYLVLPNATSVDDAVETVLHEVVGHKGLRQLFGDR